MNSVQMQFLRLLSRSVSQNITYHCLNSRAWEDVDGLTIKLQGDNDMELTNSEKTKPVVVTNECKVNTTVHVNKTSAYLTYFRWEKYFPLVRDTKFPCRPTHLQDQTRKDHLLELLRPGSFSFFLW